MRASGRRRPVALDGSPADRATPRVEAVGAAAAEREMPAGVEAGINPRVEANRAVAIGHVNGLLAIVPTLHDGPEMESTAVVADVALDLPRPPKPRTEGLHLPAVLDAVSLVFAIEIAGGVSRTTEIDLGEGHALRHRVVLAVDLVFAYVVSPGSRHRPDLKRQLHARDLPAPGLLEGKRKLADVVVARPELVDTAPMFSLTCFLTFG